MTRTNAAMTLKPCQDRKVAAIRDAHGRRQFRVFLSARIGTRIVPSKTVQ